MINSGGIGTYLRNIIPGILASGAFTVVIMGDASELKEFNWFSKTRFIKLTSNIFSIREHFELAFKVPKCDVYWAPNINGSIFPTRARKRITTIHDVIYLAKKIKFSRSKSLVYRALVNSCLFYSKNIVTVSGFSKAEIIRYTNTDEDKVVVIPNAVCTTFTSGFVYKPIETPYVLCVGNVKPHKNLKIALQAFKELALVNYKFFVVGKKEGFITGHSDLFEMINGLKEKVVFTGLVSEGELKNFYANAKLFLFPSLYEGFGIPILEAMMFKIPIVASCAASIPEVGGEGIIYFNPQDIEELKRKILLVLGGGYKVNTTLYESQIRKFSWQHTIDQHINVFRNCL
jgi:glycosyltransferase involved in cell wall biosynthesis